MILKSIEIKGFKSFADYTELTFRQGITSVVGPNGSGKSNISDAIRWCLGEQSVKTLRGGKMEDIIFSGTQFRKPISLAQVSLSIDNSKRELPIEYSTLTVSRKLYRSGESEYLINNKVCKLKDIHELFFDTGIGKEGYSLIGQGRIEAILSGKVDDRRALIEEAVGITKYKFKKDEAQNKIDQANENLIRINDILSTYNEYMKPLYIEKNKAKQFLKLSKELREIEILLFSNKVHKIYSEIRDLKVELNYNCKELNNVNDEKASLENDKEKFENILNQLVNEEKENRSNFYEIKDKIQSITNELNLENNSINVLNNSNAIYKKQLDENNFKLDNIESKENIIDKTRAKFENDLEELCNYINEFEKIVQDKKHQIEDMNSQLEKFKLQELELFETNTTIRNKIGFMNSNFESLIHERDSLKIEISMIQKRIYDIENDIQEQEFKREIKNKNLLDNQNDLTDIGILINDIERKVNTYKAELDKLNKSIVVQKTNLDMMIQFESNYDGFSRTGKSLMNEINNGTLSMFKDKCFIVGSIFSTKQKYELAIETAIGGHISDIITENDYIIKEIINYLKRNNGGRVTFHPLNIIKDFNVKTITGIEEQNGFIDFAINLVDVDKRFIKIARNILGKTIICDTIDNGIDIAKFINFSSKIVTIDSQIINPGGSITGGSNNHFKNTNILGRKRKIEEQRAEIKQSLINVKQIEEKYFEYQNKYEELNSNSKRIETIIQDLKIDLLRIDNEVDFKNKNRIREIEEMNTRNNSLMNLENYILNEESGIEKLNSECIFNEDVYQSVKKNIEDISEKIALCNEKLKIEEDKIALDRIEKAKIEGNISNINYEIERIALDKKEITLINESIRKEIYGIEDKIKNHIRNTEDLKEKINILTNHNLENEKKFDEYTIRQNDLKNKVKEISTYIEDTNQRSYKFENLINSLNIKIAKLETEFDALSYKLHNEYDIEFNGSENEKYFLTNSDIDSFTVKVVTLKKNISDLGNINLGAIEEYEELNKKVEFMTHQKEDLDKSKKELQEFIEEITLKMREIFLEKFEIMNKNFDKTFKELFKGGSASLFLGEGDELESNIEIIVQPPGKKLQNLNLLSGGEKGLSAISLLFAILRMKPVSFCVLDEIEAALDDSNVLRFSEFLKEFSSNIQFIIITHRKIIMEASDVIYGVTMQEKGISKVVSINLANYKV